MRNRNAYDSRLTRHATERVFRSILREFQRRQRKKQATKKSESSFWFAEIYEVQSPMTGFQKIKSAKKYSIDKAK